MTCRDLASDIALPAHAYTAVDTHLLEIAA
jgi:hypothetical protein